MYHSNVTSLFNQKTLGFKMTENQNKRRKLSLNRFKTVTTEGENEVLKKRKAENTNKSTKLWLDCFDDYLNQKGHGCIDTVTELDLPQILEKFYVEVRSQKAKTDNVVGAEDEIEYEEYTNNSLRSLRAALNRHFKLKLNVNIIDNP